MNDLSLFLRLIEEFCENHSMVESFEYIDSVEKIDKVGKPFRRVIVFPMDFDISDDRYSISMGLVVQDKVRGLDFTANIKSNEANMFIIGQLEEHLYSHDKSVQITNGDFMPSSDDGEGENITSAVATITLDVDRVFNSDIDFGVS